MNKRRKRTLILLLVCVICITCIINIVKGFTMDNDYYDRMHYTPITMDECSQIFYSRKEDFVSVRDYLITSEIWNKNSEKAFSFSLNDEEIQENIKDINIQNKCNNLMLSGIRSIQVCSSQNDTDKLCIIFYIDGTDYVKFGVLWKNFDRKYAMDEKPLIDNWFTYFIGYT